ncbi:hypothetical protein [Halomicrobium salinisoli]|uniref:hypothetical protein n=1 Tax=Halomicrobium salinisoli TaxID=2878391 RepID=UPI001CF06A78|nr:hypothetical protein [Halomicrobium salinisoli]
MAVAEQVRRDEAGGTDPVFGIAAGLYLGLVLTVPALLALDAVARLDGGAGYVAFLGVVVLAVAGAWWTVGRRPDLIAQFGGSRLRWAPALAAVALAAALLVAAPDLFVILGLFFGLFGCLAGLAVAGLARTRYVEAVAGEETVSAEWTVGWPTAARRRVVAAAGSATLLGGAGWFGGAVVDAAAVEFGGLLVFYAGVVGIQVGQERTYRAADAGLVIDYRLYRRLLPWSSISGVSRTDDAVVCHRRWRPDLRFAVADLGDDDASPDAGADGVLDALERHLDRRSEHTSV